MADTSPPDDSVAAGKRLFDSITGSDSSPASPPVESPSVAAGRKAYEAITAGVPDATTAQPSPTSESTLGLAGQGVVRGLHDLLDRPAEGLAWLGDKTGLTNLLNAKSQAQTAADDKTALDDYTKNYGNSLIAGTARLGTQMVGVVPMLESGGSMLGGVGDVAGATAARFAPAIAPALATTGAVLSGTAGTVGGVGGTLARGGSLVANGAVQGGAAGAMTAGQSDAPIADQALQGAEAGAALAVPSKMLGVGAGKVADMVKGGTGIIDPVSEPIAKLAETARNTYGIPITAPQMSENSLVRIANDQSKKLPFSGAGANDAMQREKWMEGVARTFGAKDANGAPAKLLTPDVMEDSAKDIGNRMNQALAHTTITEFPAGRAIFTNPATGQPMKGLSLSQDLAGIMTDAQSMPLGPGGQNSVEKLVNLVNGSYDGSTPSGMRTMSGKVYQQLTATGTPLERGTHAADPNVRYLATSIQDALDNAFQAQAPQADQAALSKARAEWRAMKTVQPLVEASTDGTISPSQLLGRVNTTSRRFDSSIGGTAYTGGGDLGELGRIGQQFLKTPPNTGTGDRSLVNMLMLGAGGAGAGVALNHPLTAAMSVIPPLAVGAGAGRYIRSDGFARRLIDSSLNPAVVPTTGVNPLAAAMAPAAANAYQNGGNALQGYMPTMIIRPQSRR